MIDFIAIRFLRLGFGKIHTFAILFLLVIFGPVVPGAVVVTPADLVSIKFFGNMCAKGLYSVKLSGQSVSAVGSNCSSYTKTPVGTALLTVNLPATVQAISTVMPDKTQSICTTHISFEVTGCFYFYIRINNVWVETNQIDLGTPRRRKLANSDHAKAAA